jgi:membrane associated rhomboid family serine protease
MTDLAPPDLPACYRHPAVLTGRACTRCGRPACANCLTQATVGSHCIDCVRASKPAVAVRAKDWRAGQHNLVSRILIAINVAVFVWVLLGDAGAAGFGDQVTSREVDLGLSKLILQYTGEWYRLVTAGFLHFGILHIAMNMYLLHQLGNMLERSLGHLRFALLYFACLLGGSLGVIVLEGNSRGLHGGASGAVFGLMGAAAIGLHSRGVNIFQTGIGATLLINLMLTFAIPGISIGGHLGGVIAGALLGSIMLAPSNRGVPEWATWAAPLAVGVGSVVASVVLVG